MAAAVSTKGSVMTAAAGMPRFSNEIASSTLPDEHDPQSPMAVMTAAQRVASRSASSSLTGALALVLATHDLADPVALAQDLGDAIEDGHAVRLPVGEEADGGPGQIGGTRGR
jgi:hypothetical protein